MFILNWNITYTSKTILTAICCIQIKLKIIIVYSIEKTFKQTTNSFSMPDFFNYLEK